MNNRIIYNAIRTPDGTILESRHVYDYKTHTDKNGEVYMVYGGLEYLRRSCCNTNPAEELSVFLEDGHDVVREVATWGSYGKSGDGSLKYILIKDMTEEHIQNCLNNCYRMHPHCREAFENELQWQHLNTGD